MPIAMAKPYVWQSFCQNLLPAGEDELAVAATGALTNDNGTFSYTPTLSRVLTPAPALLFAPTKLMAKYTNADLQKATKVALKLFV